MHFQSRYNLFPFDIRPMYRNKLHFYSNLISILYVSQFLKNTAKVDANNKLQWYNFLVALGFALSKQIVILSSLSSFNN